VRGTTFNNYIVTKKLKNVNKKNPLTGGSPENLTNFFPHATINMRKRKYNPARIKRQTNNHGYKTAGSQTSHANTLKGGEARMIMLWSDFWQMLTAAGTLLLAYLTYKLLRKKSKK
jgi:hypothetical protein